MTAPTLAPAQGRLCILLAAVLWSAGGALTKLLREPTSLGLHLPPLEPLLIAAYRVLFAGLVFVPFLRRSDITYSPWMVFTAISFALMNATYITAVAGGSAANAILLQNSAPLWLTVVGVVWLGEPASWRGFGALVLGMTGIAVIVVSGWSNAQLWPAVLALTSGGFYACILVGLRLLRDRSSFWVTTLNHLAGAVVLLPFVWWMPLPSAAQFVTLVLFGALQLGLPYYLTARGLRAISAQEAGTLILLEPLLNPVWAYLVSPETETPTYATLVGGAFILGALLWRYWPTRATPAVREP